VPGAAHGAWPTLRAMGCKRPKGARSEPKASEAPECRLLAGTEPAKARPKGRRVARAVAGAWLAGATALPAVPAASEADRDAPVEASEAAREPGDPAPTLVAAVESDVREADELLRGARFEEAIARIDAIRGRLEGLDGGDAGPRLRARTEVMAATAYVALDREDAARECFRHALAAEPALDLDPTTTAPKVLRVFRAVREEPRGPR